MFIQERKKMSIAILFESKEWSSYQLETYINQLGVPTKLIDLQEEGNEQEIVSHDLIVDRIFASAQFRGHQKSLDRMPKIIQLLKEKNIPMVNPYDAFFYEISKERSTEALNKEGFPTPQVYGVFTPSNFLAKTVDHSSLTYPCIVKPNCGGRTNYTFIINSEKELLQNMRCAPNIEFIAEQYIPPVYGFITRIEIIDNECKLILKRSVTESGLSAYHLGSTYAPYPECSEKIKSTSLKAMDYLQIQMGSLDIIENENGFYIIDVNAVSNASEDNIKSFSFDLMKETAKFIVKQYELMIKN